MAIDTLAKRISCIGIGLPVPLVLPMPNNEISIEDMTHLCWLYAYSPTVKYKLSAIVEIRPAVSQAVEL